MNALLIRNASDGDVSPSTFVIWPSIPLLLAVGYIILWFIVFGSRDGRWRRRGRNACS